jgi:hypothetical protein
MLLKARWRFVDEPRIHAGERGVTITVGHKWVRFRDTSSGRTSKVRREIFELTKPNRLICAEKVKDPSRIAPAGKAIKQ